MIEQPIQLADIDRMSIDEKILLVQSLWDHIAEEAGALPLSDEVKEELDRRLAAEQAGKVSYSSWEEVKSRLMKKYASNA